MKKRKAILGLLGLFSILAWGLGYAQTESQPSPAASVISTEGRLTTEKHGEEEWLVLHAKDATTYLISGNLREQLKNKLLELGANNLVSINANIDGRSHVSCDQSYQYEAKEKGEKELKISTKCIRYYILEVTRILSAKKSNEEIPPPKRDVAEESRLTRNLKQQPLIAPIMGEIYAKITAVNLKSPIKTLEVANQDKDSPIKELTLVISPDTRIVKKIGAEEPLGLRAEALKAGQKVTVVYSKGELKAEALFITITENE